jgi:hypothetical protein
VFSNSPGVTNLTLSGIETISFGVNYSTTGTQIDVAINTNSAVRYAGGAAGRSRASRRVHRGKFFICTTPPTATLRSEPASRRTDSNCPF